MATDAEQIATIKSQTLAILAEITVSPKPSYNIDGQAVSWTEYRESLQRTIDWCNQQAISEEPFEIHTQAFT